MGVDIEIYIFFNYNKKRRGTQMVRTFEMWVWTLRYIFFYYYNKKRRGTQMVRTFEMWVWTMR